MKIRIDEPEVGRYSTASLAMKSRDRITDRVPGVSEVVIGKHHSSRSS